MPILLFPHHRKLSLTFNGFKLTYIIGASFSNMDFNLNKDIITIFKCFCEFWLSIHQDITIHGLFQLSTNFHCSNKQVTLCQTEYFLKYLFVFNWLMTGLQYWFDFCHTSAKINHRCTYVPCFEFPSHLPPIPTTLGY